MKVGALRTALWAWLVASVTTFSAVPALVRLVRYPGRAQAAQLGIMQCPVYDAPSSQEGPFSALPEADRAFKKACAAPGDAGGKFVSGVGIGIFVTHPDRPGCILLSRRKTSAGAGTWALPGGHLELGESFEQCAAREAREETGLELKEIKVVAVNNAVDAPAKYHYVVFFLRGVASSTEPVNLVPRTHKRTRSEAHTCKKNIARDANVLKCFLYVCQMRITTVCVCVLFM